jgi:LysM repeat protein
MVDESLNIPNDGITLDKSAAAGPDSVSPLPPKEKTYVRVNPGDTIETIAARYGTTPDSIMEANENKINPDYLLTGHWIWVFA